MPSVQSLSYGANEVRRFDRERFVATLFAAPEPRERLMVLYAFNIELARVREAVREPMAGMIRLQWWREVLAGGRDAEAARHPVAAQLSAMMRDRPDLGADIERMLTARERDLATEIPADLAALEVYAADTAGALAALAVRLLDGSVDSVAAGRSAGTAFGLVGLLRATPHHLSMGWLTLPLACLRQAGISAEDVLSGRAARDTIAEAAKPVAMRAAEGLAKARRMRFERKVLPALLPATIAAGHLAALKRAEWDVFDPRVAQPRPMPMRLAFNALRGRF